VFPGLHPGLSHRRLSALMTGHALFYCERVPFHAAKP
jgi:hypothetical protein